MYSLIKPLLALYYLPGMPPLSHFRNLPESPTTTSSRSLVLSTWKSFFTGLSSRLFHPVQWKMPLLTYSVFYSMSNHLWLRPPSHFGRALPFLSRRVISSPSFLLPIRFLLLSFFIVVFSHPLSDSRRTRTEHYNLERVVSLPLDQGVWFLP